MDPPQAVIVTIRDKKDYIGVLLYFYFTAITGCGVLLRYRMRGGGMCKVPLEG